MATLDSIGWTTKPEDDSDPSSFRITFPVTAPQPPCMTAASETPSLLTSPRIEFPLRTRRANLSPESPQKTKALPLEACNSISFPVAMTAADCFRPRVGYFLYPHSPECVTPPFGSRDAGH